MIIGLSGPAGCGKDTAADFLVKNHGFVKVALADPLKRFCMEVFNFTEEQLWGPSEKRNEPDKRYPRQHEWVSEGGRVARCSICGADTEGEDKQCYLTPRHALQQLGTEWGRNCYNNVWVDYALRVAEKLLNPDPVLKPYYRQAEGILYTTAPGQKPEFGGPIRGVVIPDCRFINEFDAVHEADGRLTRLKRGELEAAEAGEDCVVRLTEEQKKHRSETEQLEVPDDFFDYLIYNTGSLQYFEDLTRRMMDVFNGKIRPYDPEKADIPPALR